MKISRITLFFVYLFQLIIYLTRLTAQVFHTLCLLYVGIGVDDMFVICEAWVMLTEEDLKLPLEKRIATMMKHAGVSITITSITDVIAFAIGASTVSSRKSSLFAVMMFKCVLICKKIDKESKLLILTLIYLSIIYNLF